MREKNPTIGTPIQPTPSRTMKLYIKRARRREKERERVVYG